MTSTERERNVLFLHSSAEYRGADRTLLQLVGALDRTRWQPVVVLPRRGPLIGELEKLGAKIEVGSLGVIGESFGPTRTLGFLARLPLCLFFVWRMVRRYRPAIVHTHTTAVVGGAIAAHFFAKGRHIWHVHRALPPKGFRSRATARLIQLLTDSVVCSTSAAKDALEHLIPNVAEKNRLVRNAVDVERLIPADGARAALRNKIGLDEESTLVVVVATLEANRGHATLIEAAKKMRYTHQDARFLFVGDPSSKSPQTAKAIDQLIVESQLDGIVTRMPFQGDVSSVYAAADIICIPSLEPDPIQMVALEAMAAERPVVASKTLGMEEFVNNGVSGLLFEPGDASRLAWMLGSLCSDAPRRQAMGQAARENHTNSFLVGRFKNEFDRAWSKSSSRAFVLPAKRVQLIHFALGKANPDRLNGVNHVIHNLAEAQTEMGVNVTLWGLTENPNAETIPRTYETRFFKPGWNRFRASRELREAIEDLDTTAIVHLHGAFTPELCAVARRLRGRGIPYVVTPHGAYSAEALKKSSLVKSVWLSVLEKRMLRHARSIQALSGRELVDMEAVCALEQIQIVPNGQRSLTVGVSTLEPVDDDKKPVFCFCGRLSTWTKGLDATIEGFARYVAARGKGSLWIVGDGADRGALEARAEELGIARRVTFFGALFGEEKIQRLHLADVFVHPSRHEGMPTAVLEAGALGLPLAVSPGTNLDQEVRKCHAGSVIPEVTAEAIAHALTDLERDFAGGQLEQRGANAAWMVENLFSWKRIAALSARDLYGLEGIADPDQVQDAEAIIESSVSIDPAGPRQAG